MRCKATTALALAILTVSPIRADAFFGGLIRETVEQIGKKVSTKFGKVAKPAAKRTATGSAKQAPIGAGAKIGREAVDATVKHGPLVVDALQSNLGSEGINALSHLSTAGANRLAEISAELAKSPWKSQWLQVVAQHGDEAVQWLWKRKGSIAVATTATAVMLQPDEFLRASGGVLEASVETAGTHLFEPLITNSATHVARPIAAELVRSQGGRFVLWGVLSVWLVLGTLLGVAAVVRLRRKSTS